MEQIDVFKAKIVRKHVNIPWGFRLEGGAEHGLPLKVHRVAPGSPAHSIGISSNDVITEIGDALTERLTFQQAHDLIAQYGDTIILTIERRARGSVPQNPLVSHPHHEQPKLYQTYDMSGAKKPAPQYSQPTQQYSQPVQQYSQPTQQYSQPTQVQFSYQPPQAHRSDKQPEKHYQTYDLNGPNMYQRPPQPQYNASDFPTAMSRPFEARPRGYTPPVAPIAQQAAPSPPRDPYPSHREPYPARHDSPMGERYIPEEEKMDDGVSQSKTFKILQSLMQNDEPYSGVTGLPPPRSLEQDRWKEEYARQHPGARVRVFMPQKYNCPMDLYSAPNVVSSFQQQATGYLDEMDSKPPEATGVAKGRQFKPGGGVVSSHRDDRYMTSTAAAVLEEDYYQTKKAATLPRRTRRRVREPQQRPILVDDGSLPYQQTSMSYQPPPSSFRPVHFKAQPAPIHQVPMHPEPILSKPAQIAVQPMSVQQTMSEDQQATKPDKMTTESVLSERQIADNPLMSNDLLTHESSGQQQLTTVTSKPEIQEINEDVKSLKVAGEDEASQEKVELESKEETATKPDDLSVKEEITSEKPKEEIKESKKPKETATKPGDTSVQEEITSEKPKEATEKIADVIKESNIPKETAAKPDDTAIKKEAASEKPKEATEKTAEIIGESKKEESKKPEEEPVKTEKEDATTIQRNSEASDLEAKDIVTEEPDVKSEQPEGEKKFTSEEQKNRKESEDSGVSVSSTAKYDSPGTSNF